MRLRGFTSALSMRTEWIVILTVYAVVLPVLTGWAALRVTRQTIETDMRGRLESSVKSVREAADSGIQHNQDRIKDVLRLVDTGCGVSGVMNTDCVRDELDKVLETGAASATLRYAKRKGKWSVINEGPDVVAECPTQTCAWRNQQRKKNYYSLTQQDEHSGMVLSIAWPLDPLLQSGLDQSNSAALIQTEQGRWVVVGRSDATSIIPVTELTECANAKDGVHRFDKNSYRFLAAVPALPGVCIASFVPSSAVLKQDSLKSAMFRIVVIFVLVSVALALLISLASTRAIRQLRDRMKRLKEGDEYIPVHRHGGAAEVRELSITFDRMVHSLRRSQAELRESEQKLSMAYHAARMWVWEHEIATGKIEIINPSATERITIRSLRDFLRDVHPDDRRAMLAALRVAMQTGTYRVEFRLRRGGEYLWASSWGQVVEGAQMLMGVTADVTSVKDSERLRAERERLIATTEMSASLAHEINNPLAAVTGSLYMAEQLGIEDEELQHYLGIAGVEARRIADIVKRLLQVHRSSSAPVAFDVVKLWSEVIEGSSENLERNGYNVQMNASGPASVVGYVDELKYGFSNLLSNAMESSTKGSTIRVRIRPAYSIRSGLKGVRVVLCDEGAGIPKGKVKEMFKPFATTKSEKGRGLGLWVTRAAVLKQGGDISIRQLPMPMHGTCVRIFLPNRPAA
jgi:signal transduction histidine kinase/HAMP domain-containing protein